MFQHVSNDGWSPGWVHWHQSFSVELAGRDRRVFRADGRILEAIDSVGMFGIASPIPYKFIQKAVMLIGPPNFVGHLTFTLVDSACLTKMFATEAYFPLCFQKFQTNFRCILRKFWRPEVRVGLRTSTAWWDEKCEETAVHLTPLIFLLESDGSGSSDLCWLEGCEKWWSWQTLWFVYVFRHPALPTWLLVVFIQWSIHGWKLPAILMFDCEDKTIQRGHYFFSLLLEKVASLLVLLWNLGIAVQILDPPKNPGRSGIASTPPVLPKWYPVVTSLFFYAEALTESPIELGEDVNGDATWRLQNWKKKVQLERLLLRKFFGPPKSTKSTGFYWNSQYLLRKCRKLLKFWYIPTSQTPTQPISKLMHWISRFQKKKHYMTSSP